MMQTIQNWDFFDTNLFTMLTISEIIVIAIMKEVLHVKRLMMLRIFIVRLPTFNIPKITVV